MSDFRKTHLPCPCGESSDAFAIRTDGSGRCFGSCGGRSFTKDELQEDGMDEGQVEYDYIGYRGISEKTARFFGIQTKFVDGHPYQRAYPYGAEALKVKTIDNKNDMKAIGKFKEAGMFGLDKYDPGSRPAITIFEGEDDAASGEEILGRKSACISVKSGAGSARRDVLANYHKIDSFDKIYLCFDNDEPGRKAVQSLLGVFDFRKVYHVKLDKHKDCNDYLTSGNADDFEKTWEAAKRFAPDTLISSFADIRRALDESSEDCLATYPFDGLNERLYGLHAGEIIVIKAPEGVGKTEFFRALEHHILKTTDHPLGMIHLEEDNATTIKAIAGYALEVPATLPDCGLSKQDILDGYRKAVRDDENRIHIHSAFNVEEESAFLGTIRFLAALGVKVVTFDHITWMGTGLDGEDERKKLDRISQALKLLAKELRICIVIISHVNDDGKTRGSRNISKAANTVVSLDRDLLADSLFTNFLVEKARLGGRTGPAGSAFFDRDKGMLLNSAAAGGLPEPAEGHSQKDVF